LELGYGEMKVVRREAPEFLDLKKPDFQPLLEAGWMP
jgi:hypothetical protein